MAPRTTLRTTTRPAPQPDGVQRGIIGNIIARFEEKGFKLAAMKMCTPSKEHLEKVPTGRRCARIPHPSAAKAAMAY